MRSKAKQTLQKAAVDNETLSSELFDDVLSVINRDLARSLQQLFGSDVFQSFVRHRELLEDLNEGKLHAYGSEAARLSPKGASGNKTLRQPLPLQDVLMNIRKAFQTQNKLILRRIFNVSSPYTYSVLAEDETPLGWARQRGDTFFFYDLSEKEVYKVAAALLLGRGAVTNRSNQQDDDDDVAQAGCCGSSNNSRRSSMVKGQVNTNTWFVQIKGKEVGPVPLNDIKLWWKYHLLPKDAQIKPQGGKFEDAEGFDSFPMSNQISMIDPTMINSL